MISMLDERCKEWLSQKALPQWLGKGLDPATGGFFETLSLENGTPQNVPRRLLVQARQIYSAKTAMDLGLWNRQQAETLMRQGLAYMIKHGTQTGGAFLFSVEADGRPHEMALELYTQAFALFGLAQGYSLAREQSYKTRAIELLSYLRRERAVPGGGFTEVQKGKPVYQSNPHMHLFEAALAWMEFDPQEQIWQSLGHELLELCLTRFLDPAVGAIAEFFSKDWLPLRESGVFIFEPGHQYEWAWLMGLYQKLTGRDLRQIRRSLIELAERHGVRDRRAIDQVWSDFAPKSQSSRFWPQCERIKALCQLAPENPGDPEWIQKADQAMETLFRFFETSVPGLWYDTLEESGEFRRQDAKASSLYHIIGAFSEYIHLAESLRKP